jgi:hypothetical protein
MQPDKQHFMGNDMTVWGDKVFDAIKADWEQSPLRSSAGTATVIAAELSPLPPPPHEDLRASIHAKCTLTCMVHPYTNEEIAPYTESLVGMVYRVNRVFSGNLLPGSLIVVARLAHLGGNRMTMSRYHLHQNRNLLLIPFEKTQWGTLKCKDDPRFVELDRFVTEEDHIKLMKQQTGHE